MELNNKRQQDVKNSTKSIRFSLSGCVKNSTRKHWQSIFDDECMADYTNSIKARELQIRRDKTDTEPIPCHCSTPCSAPWAEEGRESLVEVSEDKIRRFEGLREKVNKAYWDFED